MIVCVCHRVSDREIQRQARAGCASFEELQFETGVSTCCGCCESCARDVFHKAQNAGTAHIERPVLVMGRAPMSLA